MTTNEQSHTPGPWVAIRSIPAEGVDGWWLNAQPHAALRGFTNNIGWVNGGDENQGNAELIASAPRLFSRLQACEAALRAAREKLVIYRKHSSGEYQGGMEHQMLLDMIDKALDAK